MHQWDIFHSKWICCIEDILNDCGYSEYWIAQNVTKNVYLSKNVKLRLCDQFKQKWSTVVFNSPKCLNYRIFKYNHGLEKYLLDLPDDLRKALCSFRCLNHRLPIKRGRFWGVERDDRSCGIRTSNTMGDEYHYLFECSFFNNERKSLLPHNLTTKPNIDKFKELFNSDSYNKIQDTRYFIFQSWSPVLSRIIIYKLKNIKYTYDL
jgi:hypothetical protein